MVETCDLATVNLTIKYDIYHVRLLFLLKRVIVFGPVTPGANIKSYYYRSYSMVVACTFFIPMVTTCCYSCLSPWRFKEKSLFWTCFWLLIHCKVGSWQFDLGMSVAQMCDLSSHWQAEPRMAMPWQSTIIVTTFPAQSASSRFLSVQKKSSQLFN